MFVSTDAVRGDTNGIARTVRRKWKEVRADASTFRELWRLNDEITQRNQLKVEIEVTFRWKQPFTVVFLAIAEEVHRSKRPGNPFLPGSIVLVPV